MTTCRHGESGIVCVFCDAEYGKKMDDDIAKLKSMLQDEELQVFTVVRMAKKDLEENDLHSAYGRLRVDLDKFITHPELSEKIRNYFKSK